MIVLPACNAAAEWVNRLQNVRYWPRRVGDVKRRKRTDLLQLREELLSVCAYLDDSAPWNHRRYLLPVLSVRLQALHEDFVLCSRM